MLDEFVTIPRFSRYVINRFGCVKNTQTGLLLMGSLNPDGYLNFRLRSDDGNQLTVGVHRLLCATFKGGFKDGMVVNHIDGDKGNNELDNLEWVTVKENIEHAGRIGLTDKCCPVEVRCVISNTVYSFPSIMECARFFNTTKDWVSYRVGQGPKRVFPEMRQYRFTKSDDTWDLTNSLENTLLLNGTADCIVVKCLSTGIITEYDKAVDVCNKYKLSPAYLSKWLKTNSQFVLPGYILVQKKSELKDWRIIDDPFVELCITLGSKPIKVTDKMNNTTRFTTSIECCRALGINPTALNYRLSHGKFCSDGYKFEYIQWGPHAMDDVRKLVN